jgi:hypothetical protein
MRRVDAALVGIAVVLAVVWYLLRVAPSGPEVAPATEAARVVPSAAVSPGASPSASPSSGASGAPTATATPGVMAALEVVHKHKLGSCRGRLSATATSLRYEPTRPGDGFDVPRTTVERLIGDARKKILVVKLRGGRTYNFTDPAGGADPLLAFQKAFAKTPPRASAVP